MTRRRPPAASAPHDLLSLDRAQALTVVADWLDDCDTARSGGRRRAVLPEPPFNLLDGFVVVQLTADDLAALDAQASDPIKPDYRPGDEVVLFNTPGEIMGQLAHREWFEAQEISA